MAFAVWGGLAPEPGHAQQSPVVLEHAGADTIIAAAGERGSVAFRLVNRSAQPLRLELTPEAPASWRVLAPPDVSLEAGSSAVRVVSFILPTDAAAGLEQVGLAASHDGGGATDRVFVRVPANPELHAEVEEAPSWAAASEPYVVRFRVRNAGNVPLAVRPRLVSPHGFGVSADTATVRVEPGASVEVPVIITPPSDMGRALVHVLRLVVVVEGDSTEAVARVEVVPQGRDARPARGGLPAEVRLRGSADARAGPPVRVHAAGPLRPGSQTRVEALVQGPTQEYSVFGETDIYRLGLESPRFSVHVGDNVYRLSRLTEPGQEGLGVGASVRAGPVETGGFVQRDRRSFLPDTQYAAFGGLSLGQWLEVRGNWFRRDRRDGHREVVSAEGALRVPGWLSVQGEYGSRPARGATARALQLNGSRGPLTLGVRHIRGDSAFGGTYGGLSLDAANIALRPWKALHLEGSVEDQSFKRNAAGLFYDQARRAARVAVGWGSRVSLEARHLERSSRSGGLEAERKARSLRLRLGLPLGHLRLYPSVEAGIGEDRLTNHEAPFWRGGLRTVLATGPASFSTTVDYFTGGTLHRSVAEEGFSGTASASLQLGSSFRVHASVYGTRYLEPVERAHIVLNGRIEQRLPFGHLIAARVLTRASSGIFEHRETVAMLDYTIPLKLPVGRQPEPASVVGRILYAETGQPVRGAIVRVGGRRIASDAQGRVMVRGLEPGIHYLEIDRSTIGSGLVPTTPMPLRLEVRPGGHTGFEVSVTPAGALMVNVRLMRSRSVTGRGPAPEEEPLARAVVEFRSGNERFRRPTDERGRIDLRELRPGQWAVKVVQAELPAFHQFDEDSISVRLAPDERVDLELVARAVERRVEVIATGELRVESDEERRDPGRGESRDNVPAEASAPGEETFRAPMTMPLWEVAWLVYRDSDLWPRIWLANRERVPDPAAAGMGIELVIPPKAPLDEAEKRARAERRQQVSASRTGPTTFRVPMNMPLWEIAWLVYRDSALWPKLWLANRDNVPDPSAAGMGLLLEIPPAGPLTARERSEGEKYRERGSGG